MPASSRSVVLLLTATIDPGDTMMVVRREPLLRLEDYRLALESWLSSEAAPKIVVCENSGYDLTPLKRLVTPRAGREVEFISFSGNQHGATRGKGYAEIGIIEHAMAKSELLSNSDVVVKCTGRLIVRNALRVLRSTASSDFDIMCTLKGNLTFADSRLFAATPAFLRDYLFPRVDMIDDNAGVHFEHALASATARALADRKCWRPFPIFPRIEGISGSDGLVMTNSAVKSAAKTLYHRLRNFVYQH
ncbi:MAG: hypothetical protein JWL65_946 [Gammaproteobacteria bacterium]|nr:hypothetical protein [Gammaproteobacteria bacterium]